MLSGGVLGTLLLLSLFVRFFDGAFGMAFLFGVTMYISAKVPDPSIFSRPLESAAPVAEIVKEPSAG